MVTREAKPRRGRTSRPAPPEPFDPQQYLADALTQSQLKWKSDEEAWQQSLQPAECIFPLEWKDAPDRRWQMALSRRVMNGDAQTLLPADAVTRDTAIVVGKLRVDHSQSIRWWLRQDYPDIVAAIEFRVFESKLIQWELEARIVADQNPAEIAAKLGYPEAMIRVYETLYCDIRSRLKHPSYMAHHVIKMHHTDVNPFEWLWKHYAYSGGAYVLDEILRVMRGHFLASPGKSLMDAIREDCEKTCMTLISILLKVIPDEEFNSPQWIMLSAQLAQMEKERKRQPSFNPHLSPVRGVLELANE